MGALITCRFHQTAGGHYERGRMHQCGPARPARSEGLEWSADGGQREPRAMTTPSPPLMVVWSR